LWIRAAFGISKEWILRFVKILQWDVFANFLESQNLCHGINPSIWSYIPKRKKSGLMESYIVGQQISKLHDVFVIYMGGGRGGWTLVLKSKKCMSKNIGCNILVVG